MSQRASLLAAVMAAVALGPARPALAQDVTIRR
jgi:hypothetical protein